MENHRHLSTTYEFRTFDKKRQKKKLNDFRKSLSFKMVVGTGFEPVNTEVNGFTVRAL